ncbi:MAB_1171c family putative transporter [Nocardia sp. NPDC020380]|uniref:MAB_1171c family putative transporter n=1 Tax=Nocardia sp. NPDC020380 TaxID=3364309 RepID=UPI0037A1B3B6
MAVAMIVLGIMWCAAAIAAAWKGSQLAGMPRDRGLQIVTTCTVLVLAALTAQLVVALPGTRFPRQTPVLIEFILLNFFFVLLLGLLRTTGGRFDLSLRPFLADLGLAVAAGAVLVITFVVTDPSRSSANYGDYTEASGPAGVLVFHLVGNLFMAYATACGAYLAWTAARHALAHTRNGLRVAAVGLVIACLGNHVPRVVAEAGRLTIGTPILPATATWTPALLAAGVALFFLGVGYPGARTAVVKIRLWVQAKRRYQELRPLWEILYREFPTIALLPGRSRRRDRFTVRRMRMRYYRRVIECRDGLVCLSPYLSVSVLSTHTPAEQAALVRAAIERRADATAPTRPTIIAPPREPGMEGDTRAIIALSRAL